MDVYNKRLKLQKINKYRLPVYSYAESYKLIKIMSDLKKARINVGIISKDRILDEFYGVREATCEEIDNYIKSIKFLKFNKWFYISLAIFWLITVIQSIVQSFDDGFNLNVCFMGFIIILMSITLLFEGLEFATLNFNSSLIKKSKVYVANCYSYSYKLRSIYGTRSKNLIYIKVRDRKDHYIDEWIYDHCGGSENYILYIFKYNNDIALGVLSADKNL